MGVLSAVNFAVFKALGDAGIEIPFPQRDIHIRDAGATGTFAGEDTPASAPDAGEAGTQEGDAAASED